uniref:PP1c_bdg domain-containing protein n=1 Tax=Glossina brevipalpis TaxID=37001 RepID=A0A1A9X5T0_9MUSC
MQRQKHQQNYYTCPLKPTTTTPTTQHYHRIINNSFNYLRKQHQGAKNIMSPVGDDVSSDPMEAAAVVVNSIIYAKPSYCSIVVDISTSSPSKESLTVNCQQMLGSNKNRFFSLEERDQDAELYMMSTTMNGAIQHKISELCGNLLSMGLFNATESEDESDDDSEEDDYCDDDFIDVDGDDDDDDDSLIEFLYDDDENDNEVEGDLKAKDECDGCYNGTSVVFDSGLDEVDFIDKSSSLESLKQSVASSDKPKKVRFDTKPVVHVMHTWNYAYRAARKSEWGILINNRAHFKSRIQRVANELNPILSIEHRQKIYETRFANLYKEESLLPISKSIKQQNKCVDKKSKKNNQQKCKKKSKDLLRPLRKCKSSKKLKILIHYFYIF